MYKINYESIEEKISESNFVVDKEANKNMKEALIKLVKELCEYTTQVNQNLVDGILKKDDSNDLNDIIVALIPNGADKTYESVGLFKMADKNDCRIFIDDEYKNIRLINGDTTSKRIFKGKYVKDGALKYFDYELKFDRSFLEQQELLFKYSEQYNICNPMIFSPYSHKSFYLVFDSEIKKEDVELDFCFDENGIKAIQKKNLFWNIKKSTVENKTYDEKVPYGDKTKYLYRFEKTKKGKYVLPYPLHNQTIVYDVVIDENGVNIVTNKDMEDFILIEYYEVDSTSSNVKAMKSSGVLFSNEKKYSGWLTRRIVSAGDVEHAIAPFREWNGLSCRISEEGSDKITRYSARYRADRKDKSMFSAINIKYIAFSKVDNRFLDDYANYVLEFLEYYYPEIEWVGEK